MYLACGLEAEARFALCGRVKSALVHSGWGLRDLCPLGPGKLRARPRMVAERGLYTQPADLDSMTALEETATNSTMNLKLNFPFLSSPHTLSRILPSGTTPASHSDAVTIH